MLWKGYKIDKNLRKKKKKLSVHGTEYLFFQESCVQQGTSGSTGSRKVNQKGNHVNPGGIPSATRYSCS